MRLRKDMDGPGDPSYEIERDGFESFLRRLTLSRSIDLGCEAKVGFRGEG
jgi:hypothetical protein